jgi:hypothetical protein
MKKRMKIEEKTRKRKTKMLHLIEKLEKEVNKDMKMLYLVENI